MNTEKKYELVAWTRNSDNGEVEVRMVPELHHQAQEDLFDGIVECRRKGESALPQMIRLLEQSADFNLMTGHYGEGLRFLRAAALACLEPQVIWDQPRIYEKFLEMVRKYNRPDILLEKESVLLKNLYHGQNHSNKIQ